MPFIVPFYLSCNLFSISYLSSLLFKIIMLERCVCWCMTILIFLYNWFIQTLQNDRFKLWKLQSLVVSIPNSHDIDLGHLGFRLFLIFFFWGGGANWLREFPIIECLSPSFDPYKEGLGWGRIVLREFTGREWLWVVSPSYVLYTCFFVMVKFLLPSK